jgi:hypothetical protein
MDDNTELGIDTLRMARFLMDRLPKDSPKERSLTDGAAHVDRHPRHLHFVEQEMMEEG